MAVQTITYANKTALNLNPDVDAVNKCQATDLNEIKSVVNNNATELSNYSYDVAVLWTNPSPTSRFAQQTITLSSDNYDLLLWLFSTNDANNMYISFYTIKGKGVYASWVYSSNFLAREVTRTTDTTFLVKGGLHNGNTENQYVIPQYVIGFKYNIFS